MTADIDLLVMDAPPQLTRRRSAWSRCDEVVARTAPTETTTCQVCSATIARGDWQLGLMFIHVEGFMLMEWHHVACMARVPGVVLDELLATVQSEMAAEQKEEFQVAVAKALADAPPPPPSVSQ
jgi:hypothetical protein